MLLLLCMLCCWECFYSYFSHLFEQDGSCCLLSNKNMRAIMDKSLIEPTDRPFVICNCLLGLDPSCGLQSHAVWSCIAIVRSIFIFSLAESEVSCRTLLPWTSVESTRGHWVHLSNYSRMFADEVVVQLTFRYRPVSCKISPSLYLPQNDRLIMSLSRWELLMCLLWVDQMKPQLLSFVGGQRETEW